MERIIGRLLQVSPGELGDSRARPLVKGNPPQHALPLPPGKLMPYRIAGIEIGFIYTINALAWHVDVPARGNDETLAVVASAQRGHGYSNKGPRSGHGNYGTILEKLCGLHWNATGSRYGEQREWCTPEIGTLHLAQATVPIVDRRGRKRDFPDAERW